MSLSMLTAEILVTVPIIIDYRDGFFRAIDRYSEEFVIKRAIPPHVFLQNMHNSNAALAKWCAEQRAVGKIIPFNPEIVQRLAAS